MEITLILVAIFYFLLVFTFLTKAHAIFKMEKQPTPTSLGMHYYITQLAGIITIITVVIIIASVIALLL